MDTYKKVRKHFIDKLPSEAVVKEGKGINVHVKDYNGKRKHVETDVIPYVDLVAYETHADMISLFKGIGDDLTVSDIQELENVMTKRKVSHGDKVTIYTDEDSPDLKYAPLYHLAWKVTDHPKPKPPSPKPSGLSWTTIGIIVAVIIAVIILVIILIR